MARFYPLTVTDLRHDTRDAVVVTLTPDAADAHRFAFDPGQYLTLRHRLEGTELRRNYSLCASPEDGVLQIGIKRVAGGAFSTWAKTQLHPGDRIEAMPPMGRFYPADAPAARHVLAFAAGSGITPILSIVKSTLARDPLARVTLVYANRQITSIMFRETLEDLKNQYLGRLSLLHILNADAQEIDLFTGRLDTAKLDALLTRWIDIASVDLAFLCGPQPFMHTITNALLDHGLSEAQIRVERFASPQPGRLSSPAPAANSTPDTLCQVTVTLDGARRSFAMPQQGQTLLEAALAADIDAPFSCKAGVCSTCRARLLEGQAEMAVNHALEDHEVRAGYVLTCQCTPLTDRIVLTYDV